jgi:ABC-type branched-subunit amino acid transport system substrate-binding protein
MKKFLSVLALAACAISGSAHAEKEPIVIGQSASLSGGQAQYGQDVRAGIEAAFAAANAKGGVRGKQLQLLTLDDGGKKDKVVANTKALVEQNKATALIGYTSGAGVEASLAYLDSTGVPLIGPATGNMGIRERQHRELFHVRAGYQDEMRKVVDHLALTGVKRFAIAYLNDVGPANPKAMKDALQHNGLSPVAEAALNRNAESFEREAGELLKGNPQVILFISNARPIVKLIDALRTKRYSGQFAIASFAGMGLIDELREVADAKDAGRGLIMSQVLPPPAAKHKRIVASFQNDMTAFQPKAQQNYTSLEGYVAATVLIEGLRRAGSESPARVITGLESLNRFDLGGYEVSFSPQDHSGSRWVDQGVVDMDGKLRF